MKKDMKEWFAEQDFNTESLPSGHRNRFLEKLEAACEEEEHPESDVVLMEQLPLDKTKEDSKVIPMNTWLKWSLVAGLAVLLGIAGMRLAPTRSVDNGLSSVSPEMAQAQDFFTTTIQEELEKLNKEQTPDTERIIADTKTALNKLELDYQSIKVDFKINNDSKAVIAAMIQNFQNRIDLLETALEQIEQLKNFKEQEDEKFI
jgi:septal ring factor EnvC (AmiA/AmiB activator)